jgi:hypothetical protein
MLWQKVFMAVFEGRIGFWNDRSRPHTVWVEPLGEDYTMLPGERIEIVVRDRKAHPWFTLVETDGNTQAYIEGAQCTDFDVIQEGKRLECGHNRQAALDAGLWKL